MLSAGVPQIFAHLMFAARQEQILPNLLARVAADDALSSFALTPIGTTLAGPVALTI